MQVSTGWTIASVHHDVAVHAGTACRTRTGVRRSWDWWNTVVKRCRQSGLETTQACGIGCLALVWSVVTLFAQHWSP